MTLQKANRKSAQSLWRRPQMQVGLDLGSHCAKLVVLDSVSASARPFHCHVVAAGSLRLPPGAWSDAPQFARSLRSWLGDFNFPSHQSYVASLSSELYDYESIEIPASTPLDETERFVYESVQQLLGDSAPSVSYDYWTGSASGQDGNTLQLVWTATEVAQQITRNLSQQGLICKSLDAPALAIGRLSAGSDMTSGGLVMDIGHGQVSFVWSRAGVTEYVRNRIRFADTSAAEVLAAQHSISEMSAETLLNQWGIAPSGESPLIRANRKGLDDWLEKLLFETQRTVRYLQNRFGPASCSQIMLCGGGACIQGLSQWLMSHLEAQIQPARIPSHCHWSASESYSPAYAQALSLALHGGDR